MVEEGRYQPCHGCEGYVDTQGDRTWLRLMFPKKETDQWQAKADFHEACWENRDRSKSIMVATGVRPSN